MSEGVRVQYDLMPVRNGNRQPVFHLPSSVPIEKGNLPRVVRFLVLAHKMANAVENGQVASYTDWARQAGVNKARISQIIQLLMLAPDIQEQILLLPNTVKGYDVISERSLRPLLKTPFWMEQRRIWAKWVQAFPDDVRAAIG